MAAERRVDNETLGAPKNGPWDRLFTGSDTIMDSIEASAGAGERVAAPLNGARNAATSETAHVCDN